MTLRRMNININLRLLDLSSKMTFFLLQPDLESGELELEFPRWLKCNLRKTVSLLYWRLILWYDYWHWTCWWWSVSGGDTRVIANPRVSKDLASSDNNVSLASCNPSLWNVNAPSRRTECCQVGQQQSPEHSNRKAFIASAGDILVVHFLFLVF